MPGSSEGAKIGISEMPWNSQRIGRIGSRQRIGGGKGQRHDDRGGDRRDSQS